MCCFVASLGLFGPRIAFLLLWIFGTQVDVAYASYSFLIPLLGLLFLPWTALAYVLSYAPVVGVSALGWMFVALGLVADLATYSSRAAQKRYYAVNA